MSGYMGQELCMGKHYRQTRPLCKKLRAGGGYRPGNRKFDLIMCEKSLYEEQKEPRGEDGPPSLRAQERLHWLPAGRLLR